MAAGRVGCGGRASFLAGAAHLWAGRPAAPLAVRHRIHPRPNLHFAYQIRPSRSGLRAFGWHGGSRRRALIDLHLWNEQIPAMPKEGASIAWAREMSLCFQHSLRQLARYLAARSDLDDVSLVRCTMEFAGRERNDQMVRLIGRYGFEFVPPATTATWGERARRLSENIFISLIVLARNQVALRRDTLRRGRTRVFMSRKVLEQRYGRGADSIDLKHRPICPS